MRKFRIIYWLPNQSRMFSNPQVHDVDTNKELNDCIKTVVENHYDIEYAGPIELPENKEV